MPSRRFHTKRRSGCETCKRRKVRCGLEKPKCGNCLRLDKECTWPNQNQSPDASRSSTAPLGGRLPVESLELMHHFTAETCFTMADDGSTYEMWQIDVPKEAFEHEFLLHGLLALAALHRHQLGERPQNPSLIEIARRHQQEALTSYIPLLRQIDKDNCHSLFALAAVLGSLSYAFLQHSEIQLAGDAFIGKFIESIDLLIGSTVIAFEAKEWLKTGNISLWLQPGLFDAKFTHNLSDASREALDAVLHLVDQVGRSSRASTGTMSPPAKIQIYRLSISNLGVLLSEDEEGTKPSLSQIVGWPVMSGASYVTFLKERDPLALIILAFYGVVLHDNHNIWYLEGLGARLVRAIFQVLDKSWHPSLAWVMSRIPTRDRRSESVFSSMGG